MKKLRHLITLGFFASLFSISNLAEAHYLWIETSQPKGNNNSPKIEVYYGEFDESLREVAGGRLDEVGDIQAQVISPDKSQSEIKLEKKDNHFGGLLSKNLPSGYSIIQVQELGRTVKDWTKHNIGVVKPNFYASAIYPEKGDVVSSDLTLQCPSSKTILGIYPVSLRNEIAVQVFFKDKALSNTKANIHAPNGWSRELKADESGVVRFSAPWAGQYVFDVVYTEKVSGKFQGTPYEAIRHRATFTWVEKGTNGKK